jgi:hypothetical protein
MGLAEDTMARLGERHAAERLFVRDITRRFDRVAAAAGRARMALEEAERSRAAVLAEWASTPGLVGGPGGRGGGAVPARGFRRHKNVVRAGRPRRDSARRRESAGATGTERGYGAERRTAPAQRGPGFRLLTSAVRPAQSSGGSRPACW